MEAALNRAIGDPVEDRIKASGVRVEGEKVFVSVTLPPYLSSLVLASNLPAVCPCGSRQPLGICRVCNPLPVEAS